MIIQFLVPRQILWSATALALLTACAHQPSQLPVLTGRLDLKADGTRELVVDRGGLVFTGTLSSVRKHIHKGKGNHFVQRYVATVRSPDGQDMTCELKTLELNTWAHCTDGTGTRYQIVSGRGPH